MCGVSLIVAGPYLQARPVQEPPSFQEKVQRGGAPPGTLDCSFAGLGSCPQACGLKHAECCTSNYGPATLRETPHIFEGPLASLLDGPTGPHYPCVSLGCLWGAMVDLEGPLGARGGVGLGAQGCPWGAFFPKSAIFCGGGAHFFAPHPSQWTWAPRGPTGHHEAPWDPLGPLGAPLRHLGPKSIAMGAAQKMNTPEKIALF